MTAQDGGAGGLAALLDRLYAIPARIPDWFIQLFARVAIAPLFFISGRAKVAGFTVTDSTVFLFEHEFGLPMPVLAAHLAALAENILPILLVLGFATRLSALTLVTLPLVTRITRNLMMEVLQEDYVRTALAYGMPRRVVYYRYALKAMLIPLMTVVGLTLGFLFGGSVVVEFVFDWPGLGGYVARSIAASDFPASVGVTLVLASAYLTVNLVVDLLYFVADPRLRRA